MRNPDGATISLIERDTGLAGETISKYLEMLRRAGNVRFVQVGMAKLFRVERFNPSALVP